ncbi:MAG TPA: thioredoxin domain-containing protein [Galbitalea sp.]|nr:thioredoxin domain-containing protein [Galbitalea sp.]
MTTSGNDSKNNVSKTNDSKTNDSKNNDSKSGRRDKARETARLAREQEKKRQRRTRFLVQGGIGVVILAIVVVIVIVISTANRNPPAVSAGHSPRNMAAGGIVFEGSSGKAVPLEAAAMAASKTPSPSGTVRAAGVPHVVTFIDWSCPICKEFEAAYSSKLEKLVGSGQATLEIHPIAILDTHYQTSGYSTRAANAAACVANFEPNKFLAVQTQFYDHQPPEGSNGLSNSQILALIASASATTSSVTGCVNSESYKDWVTTTTQRTDTLASLADPASGEFGTPTVFINGKRWAGTTDLISDIKAAG